MNKPIYVGVNDPSLKLFENQYNTYHGMSYNSYLIAAEKVAVIDSVENGFGNYWMKNISNAIGDRPVDYLVVHHVEPDHSSSVFMALDRYPEMKVVASERAICMLCQFFPGYDFTGRTIAVNEESELDLGGNVLKFFAAPMVHWPEVMVSYDKCSGTFFSADAFGKFGSLGYDDNWVAEARRYYFNIVGKYGSQTKALLSKISTLDIRTIAPLHGPVLDSEIDRYISLYNLWSSYTPESDGVAIAYASIYGGTTVAALELADMLRAAGKSVVGCDLCRGENSEALSQAFRMSTLVLAAPTYDAGIFPAMGDFINRLRSKNFRNRRVAIIENGSWAPIAGKLMSDAMVKLQGVEIIEPKVTIRSRLDDDSRVALKLLAKAILS